MTTESNQTSPSDSVAIEWFEGSPLREPWPKTIPEWWTNAALRCGDEPVIIDHNIPWSWPQLLVKAQAWAASWTQVAPGDRILIIGDNSVDHLIAELAIWMRGAIPVPIAQNHQEIIPIITDLEPTFALVDDSLPLPLPLPVVSLSQWKNCEQNLNFEPYSFNHSDLALILYTSGSSGNSKGVMLSHENICSQQAAFSQIWPEVGKGDSCVSYLPWHHSFGALAERFWALGCGCCLHIVSHIGQHSQTLIKKIQQVKPSIFMSVPKIHHTIALGGYLHAETVRWVFTAGAPLGRAAEEAYAAQGIAILEGWGLTEASPSLTITSLSQIREQGIVGHPIPGVRIGITLEQEIIASSPGIMLGYWGLIDETKRAIQVDAHGQRILYTGDSGEMTAQGLRLRGRMDQDLKHPNGEKVPVDVLESRLCEVVGEIATLEHLQIAIDERSQGLVALIFTPKKCDMDAIKGRIEQINNELPIPWQRIASIAIFRGSIDEKLLLQTVSHKVSRRKVNDIWYGNFTIWDYSSLRPHQ